MPLILPNAARLPVRRLVALGLLALAGCAPRPAATSPAAAADPPLAGTYTLLSVANVLPGGARVEPYGPHPDGVLMLDAAGRYSVQIFRAGRPPFAAGDKARGSDDENRATVQGTNSHFGTYSVDPAGRVITFRIAHASFPNWEGAVQRRTYTLAGDDLSYVVRTTTTGGAEVGEVAWRRVR
jgi:Lipocalin-like domain